MPQWFLIWSLFVVGAGFAAALLWSGLARQAWPAIVLGPLFGALLGGGATLWWIDARIMAELRLRPQVQIIPSSRLLDPALATRPGADRAADLWLADVEAQTRALTRAGVLVLDESLLPRAARAEVPPSWLLPTYDPEALLRSIGTETSRQGTGIGAAPPLVLPFPPEPASP